MRNESVWCSTITIFAINESATTTSTTATTIRPTIRPTIVAAIPIWRGNAKFGYAILASHSGIVSRTCRTEISCYIFVGDRRHLAHKYITAYLCSCNPLLIFLHHLQCLAECIFNETGILKDRVLQADVAVSQAKTLLQQTEQDWIPAFEASIKSCKEFST